VGRAVFDRRRYPIVVATLDGKPSDDDITDYLEQLGALLRDKVRGVLVVDGTRAETSSREQRQRMGQWMRAHRDEMKAAGVGLAFVSSSAIFRFMLSSVFLIQRPPMPYVVVGTLDEALAWAQLQLRTGTTRSG
jgi:hypothetical protein